MYMLLLWQPHIWPVPVERHRSAGKRNHITIGTKRGTCQTSGTPVAGDVCEYTLLKAPDSC